MAFCSYCGVQLPAGANFCPSCGAGVTAENYQQATVTPVYQPAVSTTVSPVYTGEGYAVMLVDQGTCAPGTAANLISDLCGYSDADAMLILSNTPTMLAQQLSKNQAAYLAQCLTEYGLQAAIYDRNGNQTFVSDVDSVFDSNGSLLTKVASALGLIGLTNRITGTIRRWTLPSKPPVYTMRKPAPRPPVRRYDIRSTRPAPKPQPHHQPQPQPPRQPEPRKAQPAIQPRPQGQRTPGNTPAGFGGQPGHQPGSPRRDQGGPGGSQHRKA